MRNGSLNKLTIKIAQNESSLFQHYYNYRHFNNINDLVNIKYYSDILIKLHAKEIVLKNLEKKEKLNDK